MDPTDRIALIDGLAKRLGARDDTRRKWRQRGVPHQWRLPIIESAAEMGVKLSSTDFEIFGQKAAA
jgi:hypothetical protein